ncbi:MAG: hypothetical protein ABI741_01430 [Ferruginibacter sp.]
MKKIIFAFQIFGLIASLPIWISVEMNHGTNAMSSTNTKEIVCKNKAILSAEFNGSVAKYPIASLVFGQLISRSKQKTNNKNCTCRDCNCGNICICNDN